MVSCRASPRSDRHSARAFLPNVRIDEVLVSLLLLAVAVVVWCCCLLLLSVVVDGVRVSMYEITSHATLGRMRFYLN